MNSRLAALSVLCSKPDMYARQDQASTVDVSEAPVRKCRLGCVTAVVLAGAIGSLGLANPAYADNRMHTQTLYSTSFEQPKFLGGEQLVGLDGWQTTLDFLNPMAAKITGAASRRGEQSIEVRGAALNSASQVRPYYDAVGSYRKPLNYAVTPSKRVRIEADLLLDTSQPKTKLDSFCMTIAAISGDGETLGEAGLCSDGVAIGNQFPIVPSERTPDTFTAETTFNRWHRVAIVLDYSSLETSYFIDGRLLGTPISFAKATTDFNNLLRASMVVYASPDGDEETGGPASLRLRSNYTARFDNFKASVGRDASDKMLSPDDDKD